MYKGVCSWQEDNKTFGKSFKRDKVKWRLERKVWSTAPNVGPKTKTMLKSVPNVELRLRYRWKEDAAQETNVSDQAEGAEKMNVSDCPTEAP